MQNTMQNARRISLHNVMENAMQKVMLIKYLESNNFTKIAMIRSQVPAG
jgi:hypothetical protein